MICLTAYGTIQDGVTAIKNGAFDYIIKGDDNEKILPGLVSKAFEKANLQYKLYELENKIISQHSFDGITRNSSAPIKEAINLARKVSVTDTTVLLLGETGTGKGVFAQCIHYNSPRKNKSFVAVNCSAFSPELLESELFVLGPGHLQVRKKIKKGWWKRPMAAPCFWMK